MLPRYMRMFYLTSFLNKVVDEIKKNEHRDSSPLIFRVLKEIINDMFNWSAVQI